jgi:hypothetical protein
MTKSDPLSGLLYSKKLKMDNVERNKGKGKAIPVTGCGCP